jgi:hypothetical protein
MMIELYDTMSLIAIVVSWIGFVGVMAVVYRLAIDK